MAKHRWSGAGYVCADCGAIQDTASESVACTRKATWSLWIYRPGSGWRLEEEGYDNVGDASASLAEHMGSAEAIKGEWQAAITPGTPMAIPKYPR